MPKFTVVYDQVREVPEGRYTVEVEAEDEEDARDIVESSDPTLRGLKPVHSGDPNDPATTRRHIIEAIDHEAQVS